MDDLGLWDLVVGLEQRSEDCRKLIPARGPQDRARLEGKAIAYAHAADLLVHELRRGRSAGR